MADVFISYKREDQEVAQRLAAALEQLGFDVWWDLRLLAGDKFRRVIREVIDQCKAAVVLWSVKSVESDFVMDEAGHAQRKGKLCPVVVDDVELPFGFGQTHADSLQGWDGELTHPGFQALVRSIEAHVGRKAKLGAVPRTAESQAANAELGDFQAAQLASSTAALRSFLEQHPHGVFSRFVRGQIDSRDAGDTASPLVEGREVPPERPARSGSPPSDTLQPPPARRLPWLLALSAAAAVAILVYGLYWKAEKDDAEQLAAHQLQLEQERKAREAAQARVAEVEAQAAKERQAQLAELAEQERKAQAAAQARATEVKAEQDQRAADIQRQAAALAAQQRAEREAKAREAKARELDVAKAASAAASREQAAPKPPPPFDLALLHPDVAAAATRARGAEQRANAAAARARDTAARARASGVQSPQDGLGLMVVGSGDYAGNEYAGSFRSGKRNGLGVFVFAQNPSNTAGLARVEGEFAEGRANGYAVTYWRKGTRLAGLYRDGRGNGPGVYVYPDSSRFEGEFLDGAFTGNGVHWSAQGNVMRAGVWTNNRLTVPLAGPVR